MKKFIVVFYGGDESDSWEVTIPIESVGIFDIKKKLDSCKIDSNNYMWENILFNSYIIYEMDTWLKQKLIKI